ncbi:hypothetical protein AVL55_02390 [Alteromonas macleodii]|uniref:Uncharacterized protein n=1 Tax=Alteromonas macleodii TaxID=28108 RepID=A0A126PVQ6_ALTMA|nr:hypothetical protein AVL55_02390 [Alteromonas macleodii]
MQVATITRHTSLARPLKLLILAAPKDEVRAQRRKHCASGSFGQPHIAALISESSTIRLPHDKRVEGNSFLPRTKLRTPQTMSSTV